MAWLKREYLHGLLYFNDTPQISIFTLARILDTTPRELVDFLEESDLEDRLDLKDALKAIAESERLGEAASSLGIGGGRVSLWKIAINFFAMQHSTKYNGFTLKDHSNSIISYFDSIRIFIPL